MTIKNLNKIIATSRDNAIINFRNDLMESILLKKRLCIYKFKNGGYSKVTPCTDWFVLVYEIENLPFNFTFDIFLN